MARVGSTPLIRLTRLPGAESANVYVKVEGGNPTGSMAEAGHRGRNLGWHHLRGERLGRPGEGARARAG